MSPKLKIIGVVVLVLVSAAVGRYTAPEKIVIHEKESSSDQKSTDKSKDVDTHKETTTHEITRPDGTKETITDTTEDTTRRSNSSTQEASSRTAETDKQIEKSGSKLTLSALAGVQVGDFRTASPIVYGGHITKDVFGPINIGVWGLSNNTYGLSIGLTF